VSGSTRFDRAVEYYDRTRGMSESASLATTELLSAELRGRGRALEIGVGTGIVSLPLADAGIPILGLDISAPMLTRLVDKAGGTPPFPLVVGDATALPFADHVFGAAFLRHVLHLIPAWERVVAELVRVVDHAGTVLVATGDIPPAWREVTARFVELFGRPSFARGLDMRDLSLLDAAFAGVGGVARSFAPIPERVGTSLETFLGQMADGLHSWTWDVPDGRRREIAAQVRGWALERFGSLDPPGSRDVAIEWRAYDLP
jgi:SAM-dependent methyltransferase